MKFKEDVCEKHAKRMSRKAKSKFRDYLIKKAEEMQFEAHVEKSPIAKNIVVGNIKKAKYVYIAHYDTPPRLPKFYVKHMLFHSFVSYPIFAFFSTVGISLLMMITGFARYAQDYLLISGKVFYTINCAALLYVYGFIGGANKKNSNDNSSGVLGLLNIMDKIKNYPQKQKDKYCFVFTDNEEKGLLGSIFFRVKHKKEINSSQVFINLDCVGLGKRINAYYFGKKPKIVKKLEEIKDKTFSFESKKGSVMSLSDYALFSKHDHVLLLSVDEENPRSLYSQIHSKNDVKIDEKNIDFVANLPVEQMYEKTTKTGKFSKKKCIPTKSVIQKKPDYSHIKLKRKKQSKNVAEL